MDDTVPRSGIRPCPGKKNDLTDRKLSEEQYREQASQVVTHLTALSSRGDSSTNQPTVAEIVDNLRQAYGQQVEEVITRLSEEIEEAKAKGEASPYEGGGDGSLEVLIHELSQFLEEVKRNMADKS